MDMTEDDWVSACAHKLHKRWRSVEPDDLEQVAQGLWRQAHLRAQSPGAAAEQWLNPITSTGEHAPF